MRKFGLWAKARELLRLGICAAVGLAVVGAARADGSWRFSSARAWSADKGSATCAETTAGVEFRERSHALWALNGFPEIPVTAGEVFRFQGTATALPGAESSSGATCGVVLRDAKGEVLEWGYATLGLPVGKPFVNTFMVPPGVATIQPRFSGMGRCAFALRDVSLDRAKDGRSLCKADGSWTAENAQGRLTVFANGGFAYKPAAGGRAYASLDAKRVWATDGKRTADGAVEVRLINFQTMDEFSATFRLSPDAAEFTVTVAGETCGAGGIEYPPPLATAGDDRLVIPMNEGLGVPANKAVCPTWIPQRFRCYCGSSLSMPFFGAASDTSGVGWAAIVETPDDADAVVKESLDGFRSLGVAWVASRHAFRYPRQVRYCFFPSGGHVAIAKRYRRHAQAAGLLKTFDEKARERPNVRRLPGAVNVWNFAGVKTEDMLRDLREAGAEEILLSSGASPETLRKLADDPKTLVGKYDVYRDIYHPAQLAALGWKSGTNTDAWPADVIWNSADSNDWRRAWGVKAKDGSWTHCAAMCDLPSIRHMRRKVGGELATHKYTARFVDVTTAAPWEECFNPAHPMSRTDCKNARVALLKALGGEFNLVVGSETGHDAVVPVCDYFEGMLSLCPYRVPDSGRDICRIWDCPPKAITEVQVNEKLRLPLWELVYHDCLCAHWYWGDYPNKLPSVWDCRDRLNALYGTVPMFLLVKQQWPELKERFGRSCRLTQPIARATGFSEMTDHRVLSPDRSVQSTHFANGAEVVVNFGEKAFNLPDGRVIGGGAIVATLAGRPLVSEPETSRDVVIYGSTPAAVSAAISAKRQGKSVVVVSPEMRVGGLTTGGLGQTDIGNKSAFGGLALKFYRDIAAHYRKDSAWKWQKREEYLPDGQCAGTKGADSMWTFEPSAALAVLERWIKDEGLEVRYGERLDRDGGVWKDGGAITGFRTLAGARYRGKAFVDATYEGDLMAAAGVSYAVGREANAMYGETLNGVQPTQGYHKLAPGVDPYVVKGDRTSGLLPGIDPAPLGKEGDGDRRVQAYCFRMCLTDVPENRVPFAKPQGYDERDFELLFRNFERGGGPNPHNPRQIVPWINSKMPNRKTDTNNCLGFSTDFYGANWDYPEATYAEREEIARRHLRRQQGLMWTLANHPRVPEAVRREVSRWGTCKDEFADGFGDGWQRQLYVREARRMVGETVMTERHCRSQATAARPVAMAAYNMDSHHVRRYVTAEGTVQNEGDVEVRGGGPYPIDYGAIVPRRGECANLLVPVCVSASHIAFGSIRMEPVFFALGQAAGTAAAQSIDAGCALQDLPYPPLRQRLLADGQVLERKK